MNRLKRQEGDCPRSGMERADGNDGATALVKALPRGIYGITSASFGRTHVQSAEIFLEAGVRIIQYREKGADIQTMIGTAKEIKELCAG